MRHVDLPPHIQRLLDAARAEGRAEGAQREREAVLGYLWLSTWPSVLQAATAIEGRLHHELGGDLVFGAGVKAACAEGEAAGYRRAIDDACGLLDEPNRSTVRALAPDTGGAP